MEPDFSKYDLEELYDIKESLDKEKFPERYSLLLDTIEKHPSQAANTQAVESDNAMRELFNEYKKEKSQVWKLFRGVIVMFVTFRIMQYLEWSLNQQIMGAVIVVIAYATILISINEFKFKKFKDDFGKRT